MANEFDKTYPVVPSKVPPGLRALNGYAGRMFEVCFCDGVAWRPDGLATEKHTVADLATGLPVLLAAKVVNGEVTVTEILCGTCVARRVQRDGTDMQTYFVRIADAARFGFDQPFVDNWITTYAASEPTAADAKPAAKPAGGSKKSAKAKSADDPTTATAAAGRDVSDLEASILTVLAKICSAKFYRPINEREAVICKELNLAPITYRSRMGRLKKVGLVNQGGNMLTHDGLNLVNRLKKKKG